MSNALVIDWADLAIRVIRGVAIAWFAIFVIAYAAQRKLLYVPGGLHHLPAAVGLPTVTETRVATPDGAQVVVWEARAKTGAPTILYFHGNGGDISHRHLNFARFIAQGWGLTVLSYRGYSGSTGSPTETANIADALLIYDRLVASSVAPRDIVIQGESLGTGVAVQVAAQREAAAVVLESPYTSIVDVAAYHYWYLPVRMVLWDRYESIRYISAVKAPILILAGTTDTVVPIQFSRALAAAAPAGSKYVEYPRAWHINTFDYGGFDEMRRWIEAHHRPVSR